jgi:hypothetical protein
VGRSDIQLRLGSHSLGGVRWAVVVGLGMGGEVVRTMPVSLMNAAGATVSAVTG